MTWQLSGQQTPQSQITLANLSIISHNVPFKQLVIYNSQGGGCIPDTD